MGDGSSSAPTYVPPDQVVAAVLSDLVYHSDGESITPPPGWTVVATNYNAATGYYAEAWGKTTDANGNPLPSGTYSEIMQVNRGTVIGTAASIDPDNPPANLAGAYSPAQLQTIASLSTDEAHSNDQEDTVLADGAIITGSQPAIVGSAYSFYQQIQSANPGVPIIETGQSLGGATSNGVLALAYAQQGPSTGVTALTFNALPYGSDISGTVPAGTSTNYYVGNEILTQNPLLAGVEYLTGGSPIGTNVYLPDLPISGTTIGNALTIHDAASAVAEVFQSLGGTQNSQLTQWLGGVYANPSQTPPQIQAALSGKSIPADPNGQGIAIGSNGTLDFDATDDEETTNTEIADGFYSVTLSNGNALVVNINNNTAVIVNTNSTEAGTTSSSAISAECNLRGQSYLLTMVQLHHQCARSQELYLRF